MALELRQSLKLSQQLVMTPQLQQAIKLLQLSRLELVDADLRIVALGARFGRTERDAGRNAGRRQRAGETGGAGRAAPCG